MEITQAAKILGISGTKAQKAEYSKKIFSDFVQYLDDTFEQKLKQGKTPSVNKKEIKLFFNNLAPNVNLNISRNKNGYVDFQYNKNKTQIIGINIRIPLSRFKNRIKMSKTYKILNLGHEIKHVIMNLVETTYSAKIYPSTLDAAKYKAQRTFYNKNLYQKELIYHSLLEERTIQMDEMERKDHLKNEIRNLFKNNNFNSENKIDTLESWKAGLIGEFAAYSSSINLEYKYKYPIKELAEKLKQGKNLELKEKSTNYKSDDYTSIEEKTDNLIKFIQNSKSHKENMLINEQYFFPKKIELINELIIEEIARAGHDVNKWHK